LEKEVELVSILLQVVNRHRIFSCKELMDAKGKDVPKMNKKDPGSQALDRVENPSLYPLGDAKGVLLRHEWESNPANS